MRYLLLAFVVLLNSYGQLYGQTLNFSKKRGFYNQPFDLTISSDLPKAKIFYTLDGSNPKVSLSAIENDNSTTININPDSTQNRYLTPGFIVRAWAHNEKDTTEVITHTYLFTKKIISQTSGSPGKDWPNNTDTVNDQLIDYGMDTAVTNHPDYKNFIDDALLAIPSISISLPTKSLFDSLTGIYVNANNIGKDWERPMSMEIIYPDGKEGLHINAGIRIRGGWSRKGFNPKHSFRLFFRKEYGTKKLKYPLFEEEGVKKFDKIDLRTAQNYSWSSYGDVNNTFLKEVFCRDLQGDMGQVYAKSRYYHLYLNGMYWGLFMTQERPEAYFSASYMKGDREDYDVIKADKTSSGTLETVITDGTGDLWNKLWEITLTGFANDDDYYSVLGKKDECGYKEKLLDEENLIDYMLGIFFSGDFDGPITKFGKNDTPNNFFCAINREDPDGFKYYRHDGEHTFLDVNIDRTGPFSAGSGKLHKSNPQYIHQQLLNRKEYKMHFADRAYRHLFNNGTLTLTKCKERVNKRFKQIEMAIIAESARWGDAKSPKPKTKNEHWIPAVNQLLNSYLPRRKDILLKQLKEDGLFPNLMPPLFMHENNPITKPDLKVNTRFKILLSDTNQTKGTIYFTLDGTDPMLNNGEVNPKAINGSTNPSLLINRTTVINARVKGDSTWSALHHQRLFVEQDLSKLRITEIMYNPTNITNIKSNNLEFIELKNTNENDSIYLTGIEFSNGIDYKFKDGAVIPPQKFIVLASNPCDLKVKCPDIHIDGKYFGRLSNSSETLELRDFERNTIFNVTYFDKTPWPDLPDGKGHSLVPFEANPTGDLNNPEKWAVSFDNTCGSPGKDDPSSVSGVEKTEITDIKVYPNPFTGTFSVVVPNKNGEKYIVTIYNLNQQKIYETEGNSKYLRLSSDSWSRGLYFLKVTGKEQSFVKKVVKY